MEREHGTNGSGSTRCRKSGSESNSRERSLIVDQAKCLLAELPEHQREAALERMANRGDGGTLCPSCTGSSGGRCIATGFRAWGCGYAVATEEAKMKTAFFLQSRMSIGGA
jgi:hypothetical protein